MKDDSRLVEADNIDTIGNTVFLAAAFTRFLDRDRETVFPREFVERLLELGECVPIAGNQQQHRKFGAQGRHAALFNIAATIQNGLADILNNARSIGTNC